MSWLRLDDGFTKDPKFEGWRPADRWAWLEVMEYCARYRTRGRIPDDRSLLPRAVTDSLLERAENAGLADRGSDGNLWIHDWEQFNPRGSDDLERAVESALEENPDATANEVCRLVGGNRKAVLTLIRRYRAGSANGTQGVVPELVTRARSRPVPSETTPAAALDTQDRAAAAAAARDALEDLDLDPTLADHFGAEMVLAWTELAAAEAHTHPAGFVIAGLRTGHPPTARAAGDNGDAPHVDPAERRRAWAEEWGWRVAPEDAETQLGEMGAAGDELVELLDVIADLRRDRT